MVELRHLPGGTDRLKGEYCLWAGGAEPAFDTKSLCREAGAARLQDQGGVETEVRHRERTSEERIDAILCPSCAADSIHWDANREMRNPDGGSVDAASLLITVSASQPMGPCREGRDEKLSARSSNTREGKDGNRYTLPQQSEGCLR